MKANIVGLVVSILLAACAGSEWAQQAPAGNAEAGDFSIFAGAWVLDSLEGEKVPGEPLVTMILSTMGRFSGRGG